MSTGSTQGGADGPLFERPFPAQRAQHKSPGLVLQVRQEEGALPQPSPSAAQLWKQPTPASLARSWHYLGRWAATEASSPSYACPWISSSAFERERGEILVTPITWRSRVF